MVDAAELPPALVVLTYTLPANALVGVQEHEVAIGLVVVQRTGEVDRFPAVTTYPVIGTPFEVGAVQVIVTRPALDADTALVSAMPTEALLTPGVPAAYAVTEGASGTVAAPAVPVNIASPATLSASAAIPRVMIDSDFDIFSPMSLRFGVQVRVAFP